MGRSFIIYFILIVVPDAAIYMLNVISLYDDIIINNNGRYC